MRLWLFVRFLKYYASFLCITKSINSKLPPLAADIFEEDFTGEDMQVLWKWDMENASDGFEDREVDALLSHLLR